VVGNTIERNLALLTFTRALRAMLEPAGVPVVSVIEAMIGDDGNTQTHYFEDSVHLSQVAMPHALQLVNAALNLDIHGATHLLTVTEKRVRSFESVTRVEKFGLEWTQFLLPGEVRYISEAVIARDVFAPLLKITVATTVDDESFPSASFEFRGPVGESRGVISMPIGRHAKKILFLAEMGFIEDRDVEIFEKVSPLGNLEQYSKASLLALRDQLLPQQKVPVVVEDVITRKNKKLVH
jgi:hypothetical protein